jgi:hypothetical protein
MADFTSGKDKFDVPRSGGYEGMAASPDGRFVYPMLEKPTIGEKSGLRYLKVFEFDVAKRVFTSNVYKYPLHENAAAIGDFNFIDDRRALVIERDNGQGDEDKSCNVSVKPCFSNPAKFKRIYLVDLLSLLSPLKILTALMATTSLSETTITSHSARENIR